MYFWKCSQHDHAIAATLKGRTMEFCFPLGFISEIRLFPPFNMAALTRSCKLNYTKDQVRLFLKVAKLWEILFWGLFVLTKKHASLVSVQKPPFMKNVDKTTFHRHTHCVKYFAVCLVLSFRTIEWGLTIGLVVVKMKVVTSTD